MSPSARFRNFNQLATRYEQVLGSHEFLDIVALAISIREKKVQAELLSKKLGQVDQQYWKRAEELLYGELSAALDVPYAEMGTFLSSAIMIAKPKEDAPDAAAPAATLTRDDTAATLTRDDTAQTAEIAPLPLSTAL